MSGKLHRSKYEIGIQTKWTDLLTIYIGSRTLFTSNITYILVMLVYMLWWHGSFLFVLNGI